MSSLPRTYDRPRLPSTELALPGVLLLFVGLIAASGAGEMLVWYTIRGSGILAYLLLTTSVVAGLLMTNKTLPPGQARVDVFDVHSFTALLAIVFSGVHGLALLLDTYIGFTPAQLLIPFISSYRPFAVGLGIVSLYLAAGIYGSFWAKQLIGQRAWRALHFGSFLGFLLAALHGLLAGTDSGEPWMLALYSASAGLVLALTARRIATAKRLKAAKVA
jgi:predicted ferric reductase